MNRDLNMDMARLIACAAVVLLHTTGRTIYAFDTTGELSYAAAIILNSAVRWCVPVFVMLSGALVLLKPIADPGAFLWRRAQTIIIPLVVWSAAYLWWRVTYYEEPFSWAWVGREVLAGTPYYHLYFLFLIAGLYAFAPAVAAIVQALPPRQIIGLGLAVTGLAALAVITAGLGSTALTQFVPYLGYFALGAMMARSPIPMRFAVAGLVIAIALSSVLTSATVRAYGPMGRWGLYFHNYFSPTTIVTSLCAFSVLMQIRWSPQLGRLAAALAPLTLGIYLAHPMVLEWLRWQWTADYPRMLLPWFDIPGTFVLTLLLTAAAVVLVRLVPGLQRAT